MPRPRISRLNLWQKHSTAVLAILQSALDLMADDSAVGRLEPEFNRALTLHFYEAMSLHRRQGMFVPGGLPMMEARNQPTRRTQGTTSEEKIPDIQWGYQDDQVEAMDSARFFHIECKRLGTPTLNALYVQKGIKRFIDPTWSYGKDVTDGAMVGYVEASDAIQIMTDVNEALAADANKASSSFQIPPLTSTSSTNSRHEFYHVFGRPFPQSPFRLHHVWVEMRRTLDRSVAARNKRIKSKAVESDSPSADEV